MVAERALPILPAAFAALITAALFRVGPSIDLWVAGWFYTESGRFFLACSWFARAFYEASPLILWGLFIGAAIIAAAWIAGAVRLAPLTRVSIAVVIALALGPGLLVNVVFKDHWGRARPAQVTQFDGPLKFTPPLVKTDQCGRNCSFPAGHPSLWFLGFAIAGAFAGRRRRHVIVATSILGGLSGLGRMMQGGHFFSDILFSGFFVYLAAWLAWWTVRQDRTGFLLDIFRRQISGTRNSVGAAVAAGFGIRLSRAGWVWTLLALALVLGVGGVDKLVAGWFASPVEDGWDRSMALVSHISRPLYWVAGLLLLSLALLVWRRGARGVDDIARLTAVAVFAYAVSAALKVLIGRSRPTEWFADGTYGWGPFSLSHDWWSFPSAHTAVAFGIAIAAAQRAPTFRWIFIAAAAIFGLSRIWLTAHWLSDVIAGAIVGYAAACLARTIFSPVRNHEYSTS